MTTEVDGYEVTVYWAGGSPLTFRNVQSIVQGNPWVVLRMDDDTVQMIGPSAEQIRITPIYARSGLQ